MPTDIVMPSLSPGMEEGRLARWCVKEGDMVGEGDVLAEIETDKATLELEAVTSGTLARIIVPPETDGVKVGTCLAVLVGNADGKVETPAAHDAPALSQRVHKPRLSSGGEPQPKQTDARMFRDEQTACARILITPLARRMARDAGLDLRRIPGGGPRGRIVSADVEAALSAAPELGEAAAPILSEIPAGCQADDISRLFEEGSRRTAHLARPTLLSGV